MDSSQDLVKFIPHPDVIGIESLRPVEGNIADAVLLFVDDYFKSTHYLILQSTSTKIFTQQQAYGESHGTRFQRLVVPETLLMEPEIMGELLVERQQDSDEYQYTG
jgi:hypothetical protein